MSLIASILLVTQVTFAAYNPDDAKEYAYASAISHCTPDAIQSWNCGAACVNLTGYQYYYAEVINVTYDQTLAYAMIYNPTTKRFVTTYRGTIGSMELLLEVIQGNAVPYNLSNITGAVADDYFYNHYVKDIRSTVLEKLQSAYAAFPDYLFVFTGHSLGAAFASINALDIITLGLIPRNQTIMYNYGSPRVGNQALAQAIEAALPEIYRVVHWRDIVPHVPPCNEDSGKCVPSSYSEEENPKGILWPAWHVAQQVFYNESSTGYVLCTGAEDPTCSDQFSLAETDPLDHLHYVNVHIGCDASSVFIVPPTPSTMKNLIKKGLIKEDEMFFAFDGMNRGFLQGDRF